MTWDRLAEILYVGLPVRLRRASPLLGITLADGVYLTAWPLWAVLAPVVIFAFGFSVGGWHWLPQNIWDGRVTAYPAVAFMQMLPLLVIAVAVGALSAGLGLLLVAGYALGDLFISGATYAPYFHRVDTMWWLGHVTTAQLVSYLVFLLLAVLPTLVARLFTTNVPGLRTATGPVRAPLRALFSASLAALLVYAWTLVAPMAVRPLWLWVNHSSSPVTVQYFTSVINPMLPFVTAGFTLVRALLEAVAGRSKGASRNASRIMVAYAQAHRNGVERSRWVGAIAGAFVVTLLLAGMIIRVWPTGILVFSGMLALFVIHWVVLPRWAGWQVWTRLVERIPFVVRWLVAIVGAYAMGRSVLAAPGMAVWQNSAAGAFGAELFAIVIGLALTMSLFPASSKSAPHFTPGATAAARGLLQILLAVGTLALMMHSDPASAICLDPRCCFGTNTTAGKVIYGLIGIGLLIYILSNPALLIGLVLESIGGEFALAGEIFETGMLENEVMAATKLKPIVMGGWRVAVQKGWKSAVQRGWGFLKRTLTGKRLGKAIANEVAGNVATKHVEGATKTPQDPTR